MSYVKGTKPSDAAYAAGGKALGRTRDFIKEPDGADQRQGGFMVYKNDDADEEDYAKGKGKDPSALREGSKKLKTVKPRK